MGAGTATIKAENLIVQSTTPTATGILAAWNSDVNVSRATIVGSNSEKFEPSRGSLALSCL